MDKRTSNTLLIALFLVPVTASAYVGPGAGLSLLGALWALLVALATALVFVVAWPVRRMLRRKKGDKQDDRERASRDHATERREEETRPPSPVSDPGTDEALPPERP